MRQCDSCDCVYIRSSSTVRVEIVVLLSVSDSTEEVLKMVILRMSVRTGALVSFAAIVMQRCSRNLLVSKNQTFQWNIQCTAGCRQIYVIFIQRFEQIRCCDIVSRGFEIQLVCERCIFNYGDYGCLPVVTFFAFLTLRSSVAFFPGIALFAFRPSVTLVTFFPLYTLFPSVTRL